ncbi:isocitrate lyase/PEP mutase family protein [Serratia fonticola]|uniref:isocitrate lyase/PEP mutase family protein n=1 Tax=Serratia fonticola TaxID=47917 RepID=UPI00192CA5FA|nr:isocitrate lyase/phosphoenolpyruvate mutase family protein [Serratia fonticola]MBL5824716.1 isocitrate lyase/phosphoenolpyruvate mutase family protein [Serratia fonticola]MBL5859110.1 isocitrate lyase/phosphoenolpyruvate mutase family protein [Serratia fonticola]
MNRQLRLTSDFRMLNEKGHFLLANAWDIASAKIFAKEGFLALGTTSGGIAYSHGFKDAQKISPDLVLQQISSIVDAVSIPVTADIESGYGINDAEVYAYVQRVIGAGVVGINIEDNSHGIRPTRLFSVDEQCARLVAARKAATDSNIPIWINARIDTYLLNEANNKTTFEVTVERANHYLGSGADMVFIPGIDDLLLLNRLKQEIQGPINIMTMPRSPDINKLFNAGASRVSLGVCPMLACMGAIKSIANEFTNSGTSNTLDHYFYGFADAEILFE